MIYSDSNTINMLNNTYEIKKIQKIPFEEMIFKYNISIFLLKKN